MGVAETYDVIVRPEDEAYTIFAQSMDRTGYVRGTLAMRAGLAARCRRRGQTRTAHHGRHDGRHGQRWHGAMDHSEHGPLAPR